MTTTVKFTHVNGNKAVELVDGKGVVHAVLDAPGRSVEITMHGDLQVTARETGEFFGASKPQGMVPNATVDENNTDANRYESGDLPPGAGDNGSNVEDERVEDRNPRNSI
ncbi:hypothetical protein Salvo_72 [Xylella phage Salvo]|uniref:Uncharacterized protein n=1 Tax=Xylella phage Salvo TaxID=1415147 RepID=V5Q7Z7_9CAUD|nr:hypothetical protein FGG49_gp72 [Xylella phage Salvo]AHB12272.1 hypothetical protein Salvo_72 [Xylella phage Salvo]